MSMTQQMRHAYHSATDDNHNPLSLTTEPIAIVGMGCRFPGGVNSPQSFWQLLVNEVEAITAIPSDRISIDRFFDPRPATPGKIMSRWGGYLDQVDSFDAYFFGIAPIEAERLDPQQRLLLEVAWEALADAGQTIPALAGSDAGVFVGMWLNDFEARLFKNTDLVDFYMTTGSGRYAASGRLSFFLGLQGPSITVDTACSSSLVSVHLACQSLRQGECRLALAGGANVILQPHITIAYSQSKMMAPDGHCKFGDARADGYVRSEGAGLVVLKRLSDALADGDRIYAVIRGSAVNNDGRSSGYLATPALEGQMEMLRRAYAHAGVPPSQVQYVEAHGTGTRAGDPVEIGAIGQALSADRTPDQPLYVGSVKTNLGHTESAAGIAGLMKVALSLQHRQIPASLHVQQRNPNIPWDEYGLDIPRTLTPWPEVETAVAGVSAFGIAGTNAHIVLAAAPSVSAPQPAGEPANYILPLSAQTPAALTALAQAYQTFLTQDNAPPLADIIYTAAARYTHLEQRLALVAPDKAGMQAQLAAFLAGESPLGVVTGQAVITGQSALDSPHKVVLIFPGHGSPWLGMGRELMQREPLFRDVLAQCEAAMQPFVDWSLQAQLATAPDDHHYRLDQIDVIQPTLLAVEIALAELWRAWGVQPDAVLGHSMGEVGAAYIAGALTLSDAMRVICRRSQLMRRTSGQGAMAVVELTVPQAELVLQGYEDRLSIAVSNSPRSTVISGDPAALDELLAELQGQEVFCRKIKVDVASHSPQMDPLKEELGAFLADVQPRAGSIPFYSTPLARVSDGHDLDAAYWVTNLRQPVRFSQMVQQLLSDEFTIFIEMSPHPILLPAVQQGLQHAGKEGFTIASLRRQEPEQMTLLSALGQLFAAGYSLDWTRLYPVGQVVSLPLYPWQREHHWYEPPLPTAVRNQLMHPFLDDYLLSAAGTHIWEAELSLTRFPYLADHCVGETAVFPAAAFVEMMLAAAQSAFPGQTVTLDQVSFTEALPLLPDDARQAQILLTLDGLETAVFQFFSRALEAKEWTLHVSGILHFAAPTPPLPVCPQPAGEPVAGSDHYRAAAARGLTYGTAFQGVQRWWSLDGAILGDLALPETAAPAAHAHLAPPALLDAAFQLLLTALPDGSETYVPVRIAQIWSHSLTPDARRPTPDAPYRAYATPHLDGQTLRGDVFLFVDDQPVFAIYDLCLEPLAGTTADVADWMYTVAWQAQPLAGRPSPTPDITGSWLIFASDSGLGVDLAARLEGVGAHCTLVSPSHARADIDRLLAQRPLQGVVYLPDLDETGPTSDRDPIAILHLVQALNAADLDRWPRLWLVTQDAVPAAGTGLAGIAASSLWGLGRVLDHEHTDLACKRIDLTAVGMDALWAELWADDGEQEVALRPSGRFVSRLLPYTPPPIAASEPHQPGQPYRVATTKPGVLDNLGQQSWRRVPPGPGEVEIEVRATGLNFMNVMAALGMLPGYEHGVGPLGIECAGVVTAVTDAADAVSATAQFQVGDAVMGIAFNSLGSHAVTNAHLLVHKPDSLSFVEGATVPIVYLTAYYALHHLGHMAAGERVLIHAGAGGVGLAAIQLAQRAGAEIFATAGSPEKRAYLRDQGVPHVMDSRSLAFATDVLARTDGEGVDLLLNSLAGEAVLKGLEILRPYGRFLEIGKRDIYDNSRIGLLPFQKNLSYFAIDLDRMSRERPEVVGGMLREIMGLLAAGEIRPLPYRTFPVADVSEAFHTMAQAKHIGKIVVIQEEMKREERREKREEGSVVHASSFAPHSSFLAPRSSYLITGGLGALGLLTARWLVEQGPCDLVLLGRRVPDEKAQTAVAELERLGARVVPMQADVTQLADLQRVFAAIAADLAPLRGVIHAAGVLADSTLLQMDAPQFARAFAPKVTGAWHLHTLTKDKPLDFFILFSSVTALLGTPGQGNYAAGNAFLDALAYYRRAQGLPALSINWGPWAQVGLAAAQANRGDRLALRGVGSIAPEQGIVALARLSAADVPQAVVMPFSLAQWQAFYPAARTSQFFAELGDVNEGAVAVATAVSTLHDELLAADPGRARQNLLANHLREQVAQVLRLAPGRIPLNKPLKTLGLDSLMTLELRNRLENSLGLTLSATFIWNYPTIETLAPFLAEKMGIPLADGGGETAVTPDPSTLPAVAPPPETATDLDDLSQEDVEALLADELSEINDLLKDL